MNSKLFHGTCRAFILLALERGGNFGPDYNSVSFTPELAHARMFADSWRTQAGMRRLRDMFGNTNEELAEPVVLEFNQENLPNLQYKRDGPADEFYVERGPVALPQGV